MERPVAEGTEDQAAGQRLLLRAAELRREGEQVTAGLCQRRRFAVRLAVGWRLYNDFPVPSSTGEHLIKSYIAAHRQPARKPPPHSPQRLTKRCAYGKLSAPASAMGRMKEDVIMRRFFAGLLPLVC